MVSEIEALATAKTVIENGNPNLIARLADVLRQSHDNIALELGAAFNEHLASTYRRISTLRTILTKDKQESLLSIYVNLTLTSDDEFITDRNLIPQLNDPRRVLIQGTGGAGKSMLLKYLVTHSIMKPTGRIPIFVELRSLEFGGNQTFEDILFSHIKSHGAKESHYIFLKSLSEGLAVVFLDGLDEVPNASRRQALEKINSFASRHPKLCIVISSRPGNNKDALIGFDIFNVEPLSREQAIEVVKKTSADPELKSAFIAKLEGPLFEQHQTFLGVPLLVVMMLYTFSSYSEIPDRMSVFYEQAFSTLYAIHDTVSKGPYKREHFAKLAPDEFARVFEAFCYLSLSKEVYAFHYTQILDFLKNASRISQVGFETELFLKDLEESVCLIIRDGVDYVFAHRSFQEYFAAKFALRHSSDNQFIIIDKCIGTEWQHNTVKLLSEIDPIKFRELWILPALTELVEILEGLDSLDISSKISSLFAGWHVAFPMGDRSGGLGTASSGFFVTENDEGRRAIKLATALSRVLEIPNVYDEFPASALLPADKDDALSFVNGLDKNRTDARKFYEFVYENGRGSHDSDASAFTVFATGEDQEWLEKSQVPSHWNSYLALLRSKRDEVSRLVDEQKVLESALL